MSNLLPIIEIDIGQEGIEIYQSCDTYVSDFKATREIDLA